MSWRETSRDKHRIGVMVTWRCHECRKLAVTLLGTKPTPCSCWSAPRQAERTYGRDPKAWP